MSDTHSRQAFARRSFLTRLGAGAAAFGAAFTVGEAETRAQAAPQPAPWQPVRHAEDDWLEEGRAKHRFFFDTTEIRGLGHAMFWTNNYFTASRGAAYGLTDADSSVVICLRHESAPFCVHRCHVGEIRTRVERTRRVLGSQDEAACHGQCLSGIGIRRPSQQSRDDARYTHRPRGSIRGVHAGHARDRRTGGASDWRKSGRHLQGADREQDRERSYGARGNRRSESCAGAWVFDELGELKEGSGVLGSAVLRF